MLIEKLCGFTKEQMRWLRYTAKEWGMNVNQAIRKIVDERRKK